MVRVHHKDVPVPLPFRVLPRRVQWIQERTWSCSHRRRSPCLRRRCPNQLLLAPSLVLRPIDRPWNRKRRLVLNRRQTW
uniref:Uncharacterized protein n=1 Tax=Ciona intestinalis TaxID=7719 RepID=F6YMV7_CIOIN